MKRAKECIYKGLFLGISLVILEKVICSFFLKSSFINIKIAVLFGLVVFLFLVKNDIKGFFITGFAGLAVLIGTEMFISVFQLRNAPVIWLLIYFFGFLGSLCAVPVAFAVVIINTKKTFTKGREIAMENRMKVKLLLYGLLSAAGFSYLVLPEHAGISVPVFAMLQFICLWFVVPDRKRLWRFFPILIFSFNACFSGNNIWRISNIIVSIFVYSILFSDFDTHFFSNVFKNAMAPFSHFSLPFRWMLDANKQKAPVIKRVFIALGITVPVLLLLLALLSSADMVFNAGISNLIKKAMNAVRFNTVWKIALGVLAGFYLFGLVYHSYKEKNRTVSSKPAKQGDLLVLSILLFAVIAVYTIFTVVQFRYLFAEKTLPYGLTYTQYARKGFFELLFLSGVNIFIILLTVHLTKEKTGSSAKLIKGLCMYLCAMTVVLLASSFYRMWLYSADDGLTRLRFLVFGFLIFEGIGLFVTFYYIIKPKFPITAVYVGIGFVYYLILNLVPMDYFIAKNQIDMYLEGKRTGIEYVLTLSADAALQIARLKNTEAEEQAASFFEKQSAQYSALPKRWQRFNCSAKTCQRLHFQ